MWKEAAALGGNMAQYWASKGVFTSIGEDSRTATLGVLSKACFGQTIPFEGHEERLQGGTSSDLRSTLPTIMENALVILALTPRFFTNPWIPLPAAWRKLGTACENYKNHMTSLYKREVQALSKGRPKGDPTLMGSLVRASQGKGEEGVGLTESEIYGTTFVFAFAGHDTTAHLLTYAVYVLKDSFPHHTPSLTAYTTASTSQPTSPSKPGSPPRSTTSSAPAPARNGTTTLTSHVSSAAWRCCTRRCA